MENLPRSLQLVLRDRTRADVDEVFLAAIGDLIDAGVWRHERRTWAIRRRHLLVRVSQRPPDAALPEPLRFVDGLLTRATAAPEVQGGVRELAAWVGRNAHMARTTAVHKAIEQLTADGLLGSDLRPTAAGEAALADIPARDRSPRREPDEPPPSAYGWDHSTIWTGAWSAGFATGASHHTGSGHGAGHHGGGHDGGGGHHGGGGGHYGGGGHG